MNGTNLFNEQYLGSISSKPCFIPTLPTSSPAAPYPTFVVGSPQTFQVTLRSVLLTGYSPGPARRRTRCS